MRALTIAALALTLQGCGSATKAIADAANEVRQDAADARTDHAAVLADLGVVRASVAGADVKWPDNGKAYAEAMADAEKRLKDADQRMAQITGHADAIGSAVTATHDNESNLLRLVKYAAWIIAPALVLALLWWTGALGFVRGWLGLVTPSVRVQAKMDAAKIESGDMTSADHAAIAVRRTDPAFNVTLKRAQARSAAVAPVTT